MKLFIVFLSFLFMGAMFAQDKYPSLEMGAGVSSFVHDYDMTFRNIPLSDQDYYNDRVFVPTVFIKTVYPVKDNFALLLSVFYTPETISRFDMSLPYGTVNPEVKIPEIFSGSVSIKFYFK